MRASQMEIKYFTGSIKHRLQDGISTSTKSQIMFEEVTSEQTQLATPQDGKHQGTMEQSL
jgi:hypothetical protein